MEYHSIKHQGGKKYMEDFHFIFNNFLGEDNCLLGGIFDGHGGEEVARLAADNIPSIITELLEADESEENAFRIAYDLISNMSYSDEIGSTALCFLIRKNKIIIANAGDSSIIFVPPNLTQIKKLNQIHNTGNVEENERILEAGGEIDGDYIYNSDDRGLAVSRSLGDHSHRQIGLICEPEITIDEIPFRPTYLIAGTDGLWEHIGIFRAGEIAQKANNAKLACEEIYAHIFSDKSDSELKGFDNVTLVIVKI